MAKYEITPGQWRGKRGAPWVIESDEGVPIALAYHIEGGKGDSNAHYIAALPNLVKALEGLLQLMGEIDATTYEDDTGVDVFYPAVHAAYVALAKARGE